jgi:hypothetical protein
MDTRSGKSSGEIPLDEWYPAIPARSRAPRRLVLTVGSIAIAGALLGALSLGTHKQPPQSVAAINVSVPTSTSASAAATAAASTALAASTATDPCNGLKGDLVTNHDGGQDSPLHLAAALEYAYYVKRDPNAVTALYAPHVLTDSGAAGIATFINKIPPGTKYCVAARIADASGRTVDYDISEIRPDATGGSGSPKLYTMTLTATTTAPYQIAYLHARK